MNIIQKIFITDNIVEDKSEFNKENLKLALHRINIICLGIFAFSIYYFYADLVLLRNVDSQAFRVTLLSIHLIGFVLSTLFLLFYKSIKRKSDNITLLRFIYRGFVIIMLLMGSLSAVSNQRFTGNIDAYIIVVLITAVGFPFEFMFMLISLISNHIIFMIGIHIFCTNYITLVSKQINSTAMLVASILFCYSLYRNRVLEFNNKHLLIKSEYNFKKLFSVNPLPLFISKYKDGQIIVSNDKAFKFYGYTKEEFCQVLSHNLYKNDNDRIHILSKLDDLVRIEGCIVEQKCKSGIPKWVIANYELIEYYGEVCILTSVTDITELKKMENELLNHASNDSLTGILNRRFGISLMKDKLNISKKEGTSLVICFIDVDGLKSVNDKYGHNEGDSLISTVCNLVRDSIGVSDIFFRYGGDEFVILFPGKNEQEVENIWLHIQTKFEILNTEGQRLYNVSASHGLYEFNSSTTLTFEEMLDLADKKMYLEKYKNKSICYK